MKYNLIELPLAGASLAVSPNLRCKASFRDALVWRGL